MLSETMVGVSREIYADLLRDAEHERLLATAQPHTEERGLVRRIARLPRGWRTSQRSPAPALCCPQLCCAA